MITYARKILMGYFYGVIVEEGADNVVQFGGLTITGSDGI